MTKHNSSELYDLFVAPGITYEEVADMSNETIRQQVHELRQDDPDDDIDLTDEEIADAVRRHAIFEAYVPK